MTSTRLHQEILEIVVSLSTPLDFSISRRSRHFLEAYTRDKDYIALMDWYEHVTCRIFELMKFVSALLEWNLDITIDCLSV